MTAFIPPTSASFVAPSSATAADAPSAAETLSRAQAFSALVDLIREWRSAGRITTTAGLKAGLAQRTSGAFSEAALGLSDFREFIQAAELSGHVKLEQLPNKHWIVLLPNESMEDVPTASRTRSRRRAPQNRGDHGESAAAESPVAPDPSRRLRGEVWQCFVDWSPGHRRVWDRNEHRSFMYPVDDDGEPTWLTNPGRFVDIPVADMPTQLGWMREWASTVEGPESRQVLLASIGSDARPGQFRTQLERLNLTTAWRAELQRRVLLYAAAWARSQQVPLTEILDPRSKHAPHTGMHEVAPAPRKPPSSDSSPRQGPPVEHSADEDNGMLLRAALHAVIDRMSLAELASIPVRAEHLLGRTR